MVFRLGFSAILIQVLAAKSAVFALQFDPFWGTLTDDERRWLPEKLDDEGGAFDRMVADYESRTA